MAEERVVSRLEVTRVASSNTIACVQPSHPMFTGTWRCRECGKMTASTADVCESCHGKDLHAPEDSEEAECAKCFKMRSMDTIHSVTRIEVNDEGQVSQYSEDWCEQCRRENRASKCTKPSDRDDEARENIDEITGLDDEGMDEDDFATELPPQNLLIRGSIWTQEEQRTIIDSLRRRTSYDLEGIAVDVRSKNAIQCRFFLDYLESFAPREQHRYLSARDVSAAECHEEDDKATKKCKIEERKAITRERFLIGLVHRVPHEEASKHPFALEYHKKHYVPRDDESINKRSPAYRYAPGRKRMRVNPEFLDLELFNVDTFIDLSRHFYMNDPDAHILVESFHELKSKLAEDFLRPIVRDLIMTTKSATGENSKVELEHVSRVIEERRLHLPPNKRVDLDILSAINRYAEQIEGTEIPNSVHIMRRKPFKRARSDFLAKLRAYKQLLTEDYIITPIEDAFETV